MKSIGIFLFLLASTSGFAGLALPRGRLSLKTAATRLDLPNEVVSDSTPKYGWDKNPPKKSLEDVGKSHTASQSLLNVIEGAHWLSLVPSFMSSFAVMKYHDIWFSLFDGDPLRVVLWLLSPIVASGAGMSTLTAHVYEDWQIAPSKDPIGDRGDYDPAIYADDRLREVAYSLLFLGLATSSTMNFLAYQGCSPATLIPSVSMFAFAALGDKNHKVSDYLTPFFSKNGKSDGIRVLPLSVSSMAFFVVSQALLWNFVLFPLASQVDGTHMALKLAILLSQTVIAFGGIFEAIGAEVTFDQKYHLVAISCILVGGALQSWSYLQLGQYLS